jgi:hypothetical protein
MLVKCYASAIQGISAQTVTVEVDISAGINFFMAGLPDFARPMTTSEEDDSQYPDFAADGNHNQLIYLTS